MKVSQSIVHLETIWITSRWCAWQCHTAQNKTAPFLNGVWSETAKNGYLHNNSSSHAGITREPQIWWFNTTADRFAFSLSFLSFFYCFCVSKNLTDFWGFFREHGRTDHFDWISQNVITFRKNHRPVPLYQPAHNSAVSFNALFTNLTL